MASARSRIPDPSPNLRRGDEPGNQAEVEGLFARAEVHVAGFQLKSCHFRRIPRTSSASSFPLSFWEERFSPSGGAERVGTSGLPLQHSRRPAPPRGQKEIGFELQAWAQETGLPCAPVSGELLPALRTLPLTRQPSWLRRSLPFPPCPRPPPQTCPQGFSYQGKSGTQAQSLRGVFSRRNPASAFSCSRDPSPAVSCACTALRTDTFSLAATYSMALAVMFPSLA